ncbi:MAG: TIGR01777 family protein [Proteobacteria bacterium]|nr:TIGR01777 family protein [Pseudomonadota bacterium]NCA27823.1 TIGR01777 family protein [Pseudomonadota bacterium]
MIKLLNKNCKFLITGATGFIGSRLCYELLEDGHQIVALTRSKNKISGHQNLIYINNLSEHEFNYDIIINLAGAPISVYWTRKNQQEIYQSRLKITAEIVEKIASAKNPPKLLINGSAIGFYGTSDTIIFSENSYCTKQNLFSQNLCKDWENEALKVQEKLRVVILRTGVVVGNGGGIIKKLSLPFKLGVGGFIGDGSQIMSWIHIDDVMGVLNLVLDNSSINGAINLCAPNACSNAEFSRALAKKFGRPCIFHMPKIIAKTLFGQMGEELLLASQKVAPHKAIENGYDFKYVDISRAIQSL